MTFPTVADARFQDDYAALRGTGRRHRATDLFAAMGSPVFAAVGGVVTWLPGRHASAGYALHVRGTDGRTYAYYHLGPDGGPRDRAYAPGLAEGSEVTRGQLLGWLGDSGSASGTLPHLHFEIHQDDVTDPYGTDRLNPYPSLVAAVRRDDFAARLHDRASRTARAGTLRLGDRGPEVQAWQRRLNLVSPQAVAVDGAFGPHTDAATRAFQRAHGLAADGVVGPATRAAMAAATGEGVLLRRGDRGPAVTSWQRLLARTGAAVSADGVFGSATHSATVAFQHTAGLAPDGIVGPRTWSAALAAVR